MGEELTKEDLEAYFCQFGELTDIFVPLKNPNSDVKDGQHKGIAFVSFKDKDTYDEVLSRDKYEIKPNIYIVVDKAAGKEPRPGWSKGKKGAWPGSWGGGKMPTEEALEAYQEALEIVVKVLDMIKEDQEDTLTKEEGGTKEEKIGVSGDPISVLCWPSHF